MSWTKGNGIVRSARRIVVVLLGAWLGLSVLAAFFYPMLLYHPERNRNPAGPTPVMAGAEAFEEVWLTAADGVKLHAWHVPARAAQKTGKTLLVFHGNAGDLTTAATRLALYSNLGLDVFMLDYHGFGRSGGAPGEANLYLDAETAWSHLVQERNIPPGEIVIMGYSLGGAVAARLAEPHPDAAGLILESTFTSLAGIGGDLFPFLPARLIVGDAFDTESRLAALRLPLLLLHGPKDELVPFAHGERLYAAYPGRKTFFRLAGDHNMGYLLSEPAYGKTLYAFIVSLE